MSTAVRDQVVTSRFWGYPEHPGPRLRRGSRRVRSRARAAAARRPRASTCATRTATCSNSWFTR